MIHFDCPNGPLLHVFFADMDSVGRFFLTLDERHNSPCPIIPQHRNAGVFLFVMCAKGTNLSKAIGASPAYFSLMEIQSVEVSPGADATQLLLSMHSELNENVKFTILGDKAMWEDTHLNKMDWGGRDVEHVQPTRHQWPAKVEARLKLK